MFVLGDMLVFGAFFLVFLYYRGQQPALFAASQARLNVNFGAVNTLLLLTSSWFVVTGLTAIRNGLRDRARLFLILAWLCGIGFFTLKIVEYSRKFAEGITVITNDFFMYYFMYTGIHLFHVTLGLCLLLYLIVKCRNPTSGDVSTFESGATFWHMVDLLWIMLFPLLYLVR